MKSSDLETTLKRIIGDRLPLEDSKYSSESKLSNTSIGTLQLECDQGYDHQEHNSSQDYMRRLLTYINGKPIIEYINRCLIIIDCNVLYEDIIELVKHSKNGIKFIFDKCKIHLGHIRSLHFHKNLKYEYKDCEFYENDGKQQLVDVLPKLHKDMNCCNQRSFDIFMTCQKKNESFSTSARLSEESEISSEVMSYETNSNNFRIRKGSMSKKSRSRQSSNSRSNQTKQNSSSRKFTRDSSILFNQGKSAKDAIKSISNRSSSSNKSHINFNK